MKIYLLRHTSTIEGENDIILGQLDGNLSVKGLDDAKKIGSYLKNRDFKFDKIITSTLDRAKKTGEIINEYFKLKIETNELLNERSAGIAQGKKSNIINWDEYEKKELQYRKHDGGEDFNDVLKRVNKFLDKLDDNYENILIVSHSVFILILIGKVLNLSIEDSLKIDIKNKLICFDTEKNQISYIDIKI